MDNNNVTIAIVFADSGDVFLLNMIIPSWGGSAPLYKHLYSFNILYGETSTTTTPNNTSTANTSYTVTNSLEETTTNALSTPSQSLSQSPVISTSPRYTRIDAGYFIILLVILLILALSVMIIKIRA